MLSFNIDSCEAAGKLIKLCEKYHDKMEIDVIHGRTVIDGCSLLGVYSLMGNIVGVNPQTDDKSLLSEFGEELEKIK